jgi:multiple sugar transport system permease protein
VKALPSSPGFLGFHLPRRRALVDFVIVLTTLLLTLAVLFPIVWMVLGSVRPVAEILAYPPKWLPQDFTLKFYQLILSTPKYTQWLANSYIVSFGTVGLSLILGTLAAYGFSRYKVPGGRALLLWMLALRMMPGVSLVLPYFKIALVFHLYDTRLALILAYSSFVLPMMTWLLKGYMDSIPIDLEEAARVDGASRLGAIRKILLPLVAPGLVATGTMGFLGAWNEYFMAVVLTSTLNAQTVTVGMGRFFTEYGRDWNGIMSLTTFASVPLMFIFIFLQRWVVQGMTAGAVK